VASKTQKAVKFFNENKGLSQADVARKFGLTRGTLNRAIKAAEGRKHVCPTCKQAIRQAFRGL